MAATMRLVPAERMVVFIDDGTGGPRPVAAVPPGAEAPTPTDLARARIEPAGTGAVLIGPLAIGDAVRGAVVLARPDATFTAGELKVLVAIMAQVAPHVERVLAVERRERDAAAREERLRLEIAELRTELAERRRDAAHDGDPGDAEYFTDLRARAARLRDIVDG
jgi:GAF domain-containing protein